jgi:hypothetical protein
MLLGASPFGELAVLMPLRLVHPSWRLGIADQIEQPPEQAKLVALSLPEALACSKIFELDR